MFLRLSLLEWKSFFRSASLGKTIGLKLLTGFLVLYFGVALVIVGFALPELLDDRFPDVPPLQSLNRFIWYWWIAEALLRFVFQSLPVLQIKPFLIQPIRKKTLVQFVLFKSIFHWANLLSIMLFLPCVLMLAWEGWYSTEILCVWLFTVLSVSGLLHFLNFLLQKKWMDQPKVLLTLVLVLMVLTGLDYFGVYSASNLVGMALNAVITYPILILVPIGLMVFSYVANARYLQKQLYLDKVVRDKSIGYSSANFTWTERFGKLAPFLQMDLMLLQRNKRTRSMVGMTLFFLLYGFIFYPNPTFHQSSMLVMIGVILSGMFLINFGQFVPSWDGSYFSFLMVQKTPFQTYLQSKALLMALSVGVLTLLSLPYGYFGWDILLINLCCAVYNLGVNIPVVLYMGAYNKKKIDLDKAQFFNYQGTGMTQWIVGIPLFLGPMLFWGIAKLFFNSQTASLTLLLMGLIGLLLRKPIFKAIEHAYRARKYEQLEGFKQID